MVLSFKQYQQYLREFEDTGGGQAAGKLEVANASLPEARNYAQKKFAENGKDFKKEIPDFDKNFKEAQAKAKKGSTVRKDMPVIEDKDVKDLQRRLQDGAFDDEPPYAPDTKPSNPFPEGLTGDQAKKFVTNGFRDKKLKDDITKCKITTVKCNDLTPIQKQIYLDKCIDNTAKGGADASKKFLSNSTLIISSDNHIIDGHHRWMSGMMIDPDMTMKALQIDLPIRKLLPLTLAYSDAVGNKRNQ